jgi:hypothetical protein
VADDSSEPKAPAGEPDSVGYIGEAFRWQYNLIALAGAAAFAAVSQSPLPLVLAAGLELIYLSTVPRLPRFRRLVRSRRYEAEKRRHAESLESMLGELPTESRKRYATLHAMCETIRANHARLSSTSQILVGQMEERLQGLLQAYLRLLHAEAEHERYVRTTDGEAIKREIAGIERRLSSDSPKVQEINTKRIEILRKRVEKFETIRENRQVVQAQCAAIEDMLELMRDQSVTMRDPNELSDRLESLVREVEQTEQTVREVETIFQTAVAETPGTVVPLPTDAERSGARRRVKGITS